MFITLHLEVGHHIRFNIRRLLTDLLFFIHSIFSRFNYESLCAELTQCNDDKQCHFLLSYAMDFSMQFTDQYTEYKNANVALFANLFLSVCRFFFISSNFKYKPGQSLNLITRRVSSFAVPNWKCRASSWCLQTGFFYIYEII